MQTGKITREQAERMRLQPFGKKHQVRIWIESLQPGELLQVSREDFNWRHRTPAYFCNEISKTKRWKFKVWKMYPFIGWVIERVE